MLLQTSCWNRLWVYGVNKRISSKKFSGWGCDSGPGDIPGSQHLSAFGSALQSVTRDWFLSQAWWPCGFEPRSVVSGPSPTSYFPQCNSQAARDKGQGMQDYKQSLPVWGMRYLQRPNKTQLADQPSGRDPSHVRGLRKGSRTHTSPTANKLFTHRHVHMITTNHKENFHWDSTFLMWTWSHLTLIAMKWRRQLVAFLPSSFFIV